MIEFNIGDYAIRGRNPSIFLQPPAYYDLYVLDNEPMKISPEDAAKLEDILNNEIKKFVKNLKTKNSKAKRK